MQKISILVLAFFLPVVVESAGAQTSTGTSGTPLSDVTVTNAATLIVGANSSRHTLSCTNNSATVAVRWGNSAVTASAGERFPAGTSIEITNRMAIYMISEGANVTVSCTEETK